MSPSRNEHTIAASCEVSGRGYWSGLPVTVRIHPADSGTGVRLVRTDLPGAPTCSVSVATTQQADYRTNLQSGTARFQMVEHLLAALAALEIDNCCVEVNAEELPGLDGSSYAYVEALRFAGLIVQARSRPRLVIRTTHRIEASGSWIEARPSPDGTAHYQYQLEFDPRYPIPSQSYQCRLTPRRFANDIAPARTFVTKEQADNLRDQGVAQHVTHQDLLVFGDEGVIGNRLRFRNECARHKTLDLIGDLSVVGMDLVGSFVSHRGGHRLNAAMARLLQQLYEQRGTLPGHVVPERRVA